MLRERTRSQPRQRVFDCARLLQAKLVVTKFSHPDFQTRFSWYCMLTECECAFARMQTADRNLAAYPIGWSIGGALACARPTFGRLSGSGAMTMLVTNVIDARPSDNIMLHNQMSNATK